MKGKGRGFTLIELMIVMAIMAVLVGMILPRFKGMRDQASVSKAQGEVRAIKTAIESYYITNNAYPATSTTVCATYLTLSSTYPRILTSAIYDPFGATSTTEYRFIKSTSGLYYVIFSIGPDATADITGIGDDGVVAPANRDDDVWTSNAI
ncbi:MAG: prepilin-type N-terminal cleavage/methylation domain-containing protein [Candidatus Omnitrophota bacterium]